MRTFAGAVAGAVISLTVLATIAAAEETPAPNGPAAQPTTTPSDNNAETPPAADDDQKIVCKKEPPPIGSRMGARKVCHTVAEWRRIQAAAKETTDEIQNRKVPPPGQ